MKTNSNDALVALILKAARKGTFTGIITQKKGEARGRGSARMVYGDDVVHTVMITGFSYENLVRRSLKSLLLMKTDDLLALSETQNLRDKDGNPIHRVDIQEAWNELRESFERTLDPTMTSTSTTAHVYEPLVVNEEQVTGAKVYRCVKNVSGEVCHCRACTGDERAPLDGTIHLDGLKVWSKVLVPAPNGPVPASKSAAKTVAKNMIRRLLPVSRYVSYVLEPGTDFMLRAGGAAALEAANGGFKVTPELIEAIQAA